VNSENELIREIDDMKEETRTANREKTTVIEACTAQVSAARVEVLEEKLKVAEAKNETNNEKEKNDELRRLCKFLEMKLIHSTKQINGLNFEGHSLQFRIRGCKITGYFDLAVNRFSKTVLDG
jgi:hypothetical protein